MSSLFDDRSVDGARGPSGIGFIGIDVHRKSVLLADADDGVAEDGLTAGSRDEDTDDFAILDAELLGKEEFTLPVDFSASPRDLLWIARPCLSDRACGRRQFRDGGKAYLVRQVERHVRLTFGNHI